MKYIIFALMIFMEVALFSQNSYCEIKPFSNNAQSSTSISSCFDFNTNYQSVPIMTINVNVQYLNNRFSTHDEAAVAIKKFIKDANNFLSNFDQYNLNGPNGLPSALVPSAKIQLKLYSDATEPNDTYGGIWITDDAYVFGVAGNHPALKYGDKVLNIILNDNQTITSQSCDSNGFVTGVGNTGDNTVYVSNLYCKHFYNITKTTTIATMIHEVFHKIGLYHAYQCDNICRNIDIRIESECRSRCPTEQICAISGDGCGRDGFICGGSDQVCDCYQASNNFMSQGGLRASITPCQWSLMFNTALSKNPKFAILCYSASTFTLPQSPLNDYRASQSITSTSVLQGDRQVDYWSPTITLNPGFEVRQGTSFIAAPSTFPCCTGSGNGGGDAVSDNNSNTPINKIKDGLLITPNPFNESVSIDYEVS